LHNFILTRSQKELEGFADIEQKEVEKLDVLKGAPLLAWIPGASQRT
jgi:hypothetical protein